MTFEDLLNNLWGFDAEVFAHDSLFVFINYNTREEKIFHNCPGNDIQEWLDKTKPILMGYYCNGYDKYILKGWLCGMPPEDLKQLNDFIQEGNNGWEWKFDEYIELPIMWDLMGNIKTYKSLKELEGNLRMSITETTIPFNLPTKWTEQQRDEVIYYCRHDVLALFPVFEKLIKKYKSKYVIAKLGSIEPIYALSLTDANLTATLLGGEKIEHSDNFKYTYPSQIDKSKIPKEMLNYIDDLIEHNSLEYKLKPPLIDYDTMEFQVGVGGCHGFSKRGYYEYDKGVPFKCD